MDIRRMNFWGWGWADEAAPDPEGDRRRARDLAAAYGVADIQPLTRPRVEEFDLPPPRMRAPPSLAALCTTDPHERLIHSLGKSFADLANAALRRLPWATDLVAYPETEVGVAELLDWAALANAAVIPFGGGSSVCGGIDPAVGEDYAGVVTVDLRRLRRVLEVDRVSRAARIQAGVLGPDLEAQLRPHGYTLRHFPQSFEFSSLGGWIATRSGGHYASLYTHIDDLVESLRTVTPAGVLESRRLPGSGAGPSPDRMLIGSEGVMGIVTEAWMRVQDRPRFRASIPVLFADFLRGAEAVRALSQAWLFPTNCRLIDADEAREAAGGPHALLILGFESADHPVGAWMNRALELVADHGGQFDRAVLQAGDSNREGAAGAWRDAFMRAPYARAGMIACGLIGDTFETAITWERFPDFHARVVDHMRGVIERVTGRPARVTCRFTHVYPDGPAPYFSYAALSHPERMIDDWREIKAASIDVVTRLGGTVTHHHAVGRDHRAGYERQVDPLFRRALQAAKASLDPAGIMNPGVLIDPAGRRVGQTGVMER
jgi:alkyldihydroxyacetonephosphate synthase